MEAVSRQFSLAEQLRALGLGRMAAAVRVDGGRSPAAAGVAAASAGAGVAAAAAAAPSSIVSISAAGAQAAAGAPVARAASAVDYTDRIKLSGKRSIDALLAGGNRWFHTPGASGAVPSASARSEISFSFLSSAAGLPSPDANGFQALNDDQRDVVRAALQTIEQSVNVRFTETASGGDLQFGSNNQSSSAGYARYPNEGSQVLLANNASTFAGSWEPGSYQWMTILHETAHALGLKHPGNYNAGGGGTPGPYLAAAVDNRANTIMSYRDAASLKRIAFSNGSFSSSTVNASTLQGYDVAALQYLYGAPGSSDAIRYQWSAGQAMTQTIWNANPDSEIDLSNQTADNVVDLRAGRYSSIALRDAYADMGPYDKASYARLTSGGRKLTALLGVPGYTGRNNLLIAAGSRIGGATGGSGNDTLITNSEGNRVAGGAGNDAVYYSGGNATLAGGDGDDTVYLRKQAGTRWALSADRSSATWTRTDARTGTVTTLATVSLSGFEHVKFWDGNALKAVGTALVA